MTRPASESWPVAIFAHNEAEHILACLESLVQAAPGKRLECFILANACADETGTLVTRYAEGHPGIHLVSIEVGDKSNAWNVYAHEIAPAAEVHFFIDGDVEACPGALAELYATLQAHPQANAAAALPVTGRSLRRGRQEMLEGGELAGNLYALRGSFVDRVRQGGVRLHVGFIGEDSLVGALANWDLDPNGGWDARRVVPAPAAGFRFRSLSWLRLDHWRLYWRRRIRYSLRRYQIRMLRPVLKREGINGMPSHVSDLYRQPADSLPLRWSGANTMFDWLALRWIRREAVHAEENPKRS